jgi:DNA-binding NarL/FixJ family response regulator
MIATAVLADDETCVRQTTAYVLRMEKVEVIGQATNGEEALAMCRELRPTFLLADLRLPKLDAVGVLLRMRAEKLGIPMMIYTGCENDQQLHAALDAKPAVIVHKSDQLDDFRMGLHCAAEGRSYLSPRPSRLNASPRQQSPADTLTQAEIELLKLLAVGHSNKMAADALLLSEHTVSNRREQIMRKLGVHELASLVLAAVRMGLVDCSEQ